MLLTISGSLRKESSNTKLCAEAARVYGGPSVAGNIRLPLYDNDVETATGLPDEVETLVEQVRAAEAVVISTPEYNKNLSGVLKNALDWVSRAKGGPWQDKPVAIMSASTGRAGGARGQFSLRLSVTPFGPRLLTAPEMMLADSRNQFDENGHLKDERYAETLAKLMEKLRIEVARG